MHCQDVTGFIKTENVAKVWLDSLLSRPLAPRMQFNRELLIFRVTGRKIEIYVSQNQRAMAYLIYLFVREYRIDTFTSARLFFT